jgi:opacity protein-like surface antigen
VQFPALAVVFALPAILQAGFCSADDRQPRHDFQFFAGYSPVSPTLIGTAPDRRLVLAGFAYGFRCWSWNSVSVSYTVAAMPAAILIQPYEGNAPAHAVYGFAVAPLGFTFDLARKRRGHPFVETTGGIVASTQPIPENQPDASGLNFFFDLGGGIRWRVGERGAVSLGYRFLHISNAGTTSFNPGVDNNVFYVGYSFLR